MPRGKCPDCGQIVDLCDECGAPIPVFTGDSIANRHHAESCSLFDAGED